MAFGRRDHLRQHLQGYHKLKKEDLESYKVRNNGPVARATYRATRQLIGSAMDFGALPDFGAPPTALGSNFSPRPQLPTDFNDPFAGHAPMWPFPAMPYLLDGGVVPAAAQQISTTAIWGQTNQTGFPPLPTQPYHPGFDSLPAHHPQWASVSAAFYQHADDGGPIPTAAGDPTAALDFAGMAPGPTATPGTDEMAVNFNFLEAVEGEIVEGSKFNV